MEILDNNEIIDVRDVMPTSLYVTSVLIVRVEMCWQ